MITLICFLVMRFLLHDEGLYAWLIPTGIMDGLIAWVALIELISAIIR